MIKTRDFFPVALRDKALYAKISEILDYLIAKNYDPEIQSMSDRLNPQGAGFDVDEFLKLIDGFSYKEYLFGGVDPKTVAHMLPAIYNLKGTKRGLQLLLDILGIDATVYVWWEVLRAVDRGQPLATEFFDRFVGYTAADITECQIYLHYVDKGGSLARLGVDADAKLAELTNSFLWVCANIAVINLLNSFSDTVVIGDGFEFGQETTLTDTYSAANYRFSQGYYDGSGAYSGNATYGDILELVDAGFTWTSSTGFSSTGSSLTSDVDTEIITEDLTGKVLSRYEGLSNYDGSTFYGDTLGQQRFNTESLLPLTDEVNKVSNLTTGDTEDTLVQSVENLEVIQDEVVDVVRDTFDTSPFVYRGNGLYDGTQVYADVIPDTPRFTDGLVWRIEEV